jgi:hypothetical protein
MNQKVAVILTLTLSEAKGKGKGSPPHERSRCRLRDEILSASGLRMTTECGPRRESRSSTTTWIAANVFHISSRRRRPTLLANTEGNAGSLGCVNEDLGLRKPCRSSQARRDDE